MHEPEIYERNNHGIGHAAATALHKMGKSIKWRPENTDTILDFGCGTGNVLIDVVLPVFKGRFSTCFGTDISETMIDFAAQKYAGREDVKFLTMDINKVSDFLVQFGQVDHVISSFAIHWITDLDAGFKGIYELLNPGGDFFTDHVCSSFLYDVYDTVGKDERWGKYFENIERFVQPSHKSLQPADDLRDQLVRAGFTDVVVDIITLDWHFENLQCLRKLLNSVAVQISNIPEDELEEYLDYLLEFGMKMKGITQLASGGFVHHVKVFVAYARKPGNS